MGRLQEGKTLETAAPIKQLRHWHKSMARMAVAKGARPLELSKIFGVTTVHMTRILESPLFLAEMNRLEALADYESLDMKAELRMRQPKALEILDDILVGEIDGEDVPLRMRKDVSLEILDRTGYGKGAAVQKHLHLHQEGEIKELSDEELDARIGGLLDERAGDIIDLTEEEEREVTDDEEDEDGTSTDLLLPMIMKGGGFG